MTEEALLTVAEAARILRIGERTCYRLIEAGALPAVRMGRSVRIPRDALMKYLDEMALASVAPRAN